jgi:hypothetical protein
MRLRLSRPVYESLPLLYMVIGAMAFIVFYLDSPGIGGKIAFVIGLCAEIAALTLFLRRLDYRALSREYSGETIEL